MLTDHPYVSFSVVELDDVQADKFTTFYKSVILYGNVKRLEKLDEIQRAMELTVNKYSPGLMESGRKFIESQQGHFCAYELEIVHMTGKRSE